MKLVYKKPKYEKLDLTEAEDPHTVRYVLTVTRDRAPYEPLNGCVLDVLSYLHLGGGTRTTALEWAAEQLGVKVSKTGHYGEIKHDGHTYSITVSSGVALD